MLHVNKNTRGPNALNRVKRWPQRNKFSPLFFSLVLCLFTFLNTSAQTTQLKYWIAGDKGFIFPSYPASGLPDKVRQYDTIPILYGAPSVGPVNAATDEAGNVLFYVRHHRLWDSKDKAVTIPFMHRANGDTNAYNNQGDVAIVPVIEPANSCFKRYYLFYTRLETYVQLQITMVTVNLNTKEVTASFLWNPTSFYVFARGTPQYFNNGKYLRTNGLAVTPDRNGKRYVYFVGCDGVYKITLTAPSPTYPDGIMPSVKMPITTPGVKFYASQASLSFDGTKLAWGVNPDEIPISTPVNGSQYYVMGLDSNGNWDNDTIQTYNLPSNLTGSSLYGCRGVVFNQDATKLFVSAGDVGYGVYAIDLPTGTYRMLPSSGLAGVSQLRIASNGLLYCLEEKALKAYNPSTELLIRVDSVNTHYPYDSIQFLPNIIYNEKKSDVPDFGIKMELTSSTTFDGTVVGNLKINDTLSVWGWGTELYLKDITVEFAENAVLYMGPGTVLKLDNCKLKALEYPNCPDYKRMWQGVQAWSENAPIKIHINTRSFEDSVEIRDAILGLGLRGPDVEIVRMKNTVFRANETHLALAFNATVGDGEYTTFIGEEPLRDQTKGDENGYTDGLKRTKYGLVVTSARIDLGYGIECIGGQYGIYASDPRAGSAIHSSRFISQKRTGVMVAYGNDPNLDLLASHNLFAFCNNGLKFSTCTKVNLWAHSNTFDHITYNGIEFARNVNCEIYIGDTTSQTPSAGNDFTNSGAAAIYLNDNPGSQASQIVIARNNIYSTTPYSHGIIVGENSGGTRKYSHFKIERNYINNTARGIQFWNSVGGNPDNPVVRRLDFYPVSQVRNNTINLDPTSGSNGIETGASRGHSYLGNTVYGNRYGRAANIVNSTASLYNGNLSNTGFGLMAQGYMYHSNYYCNTFNQANYGLYLANHRLRTYSGFTHGDSITGGRDNNFGSKPKSKPQYEIVLDSTNFLFNRWKFSATWGTPGITSVTGGSTWIFAGYEYDACGEPGIPGDDFPGHGVVADVTGSHAIFWDEYTRQQNFKMDYDSIGSTDSNVVRLIDAEDYIATRNFSAALGRINAIVITPSAPDEGIMTDYKLLYQTYLAYRIQDTIDRNMNDSMVAILTTIAEKNPVTESPASHTAQVILYHERGLTFEHTQAPGLVIAGYLTNACELPVIENLPVYLLDADGQVVEGPVYTDADGQFAFDGSVVDNYSNGTLYRMRMILPDGSAIESDAALMEDMALNSDHEFDCSNVTNGPLNIEGLIHPGGCPDMDPSGIAAYLIKETGEVVDGPVMVGSSGTFAFDPVITALHNNTGLYKIRLVFVSSATVETTASTIAGLAASSVHEFNCPGEPPIILPKKGNDKEPLNYKDQAKKQASEDEIPFSISPNPSTGLFVIKGVGSGATASLTNLLGQVVLKDVPLLNGILDASHLKRGVYLLTVTGKHNTYVHKVNLIK